MKYYAIRGFFKTQPIIIVRVDEKQEEVTGVYTLSGNELSEYTELKGISVNAVTQVPELEECLITDKKNKKLIEQKLEHIYNGILERISSPEIKYILPEISGDVQKQIEDTIEFIKTEGLSIEQKIEIKKSEQSEIEKQLRQIHKNSKNDLSKLTILSIIGVLIVMLSTGNYIEKLPNLVQFISSAIIAATPIIISTEYVRSRERKQTKELIKQHDLNESYIDKYEIELSITYETPELKQEKETYMSREKLITELLEIKKALTQSAEEEQTQIQYIRVRTKVKK